MEKPKMNLDKWQLQNQANDNEIKQLILDNYIIR